MIDNLTPTSQFHPYQRETSVPVAERRRSGLQRILGKVKGKRWINNVRAYAKANPTKVMGGLAAITVGLSLMRRRRT